MSDPATIRGPVTWIEAERAYRAHPCMTNTFASPESVRKSFRLLRGGKP